MAELSAVKALTFDVFGTVSDWRSTIIRQGQAFANQRAIEIDWVAFAAAWRGGYEPAMQRVNNGELPWTHIDVLHRMILEDILPEFGIEGLSEEDKSYLNQVWHRLDFWPDSIAGIERLRQNYTVAALSNGNVSLLVNMAKNAGLAWDCVLSAELAKRYKPEPQVYLLAAQLLGLEPHEVMMVAAHNHDLLGAQRVGFKTAFVLRATEYGPGQETDLEADPSIDVVAADFNDLADKLIGK